jgi:hypothetical protein
VEVNRAAFYVDNGTWKDMGECSSSTVPKQAIVQSESKLSLVDTMTRERSGKNEAAVALASQITDRKIASLGDIPIKNVVLVLNKINPMEDKTHELTECIYKIFETTLVHWRNMNDKIFLDQAIDILDSVIKVKRVM